MAYTSALSAHSFMTSIEGHVKDIEPSLIQKNTPLVFSPEGIQLPSTVDQFRVILEQVEAFLQSNEVVDADKFAILMALDEAGINAIKHGNQHDPKKNVYLQFTLTDTEFTARIRDEGAGFDPEDVPDPTDVENLERPCGRGLLMMRHYMNTVEYRGLGNEVFMQKALVREQVKAALVPNS